MALVLLNLLRPATGSSKGDTSQTPAMRCPSSHPIPCASQGLSCAALIWLERTSPCRSLWLPWGCCFPKVDPLEVAEHFVLSVGTTGKVLAPSSSPSGVHSHGESLSFLCSPALSAFPPRRDAPVHYLHLHGELDCPLLDFLQYVHVSHGQGSAEQDPALLG